MNEWDAFERELIDSVAEQPPSEKTVRAVTPWREAMDRIVLGLCLTSVTLDIWYLKYILMAVGTVQLYLGLRTLRENNRWFRFAWICGACKAIILYGFYLLYATPIWLCAPSLCWVLNTGLTLTLYFALRQALREASASMGRRSRRDPMLGALLWTLVLTLTVLFLPDVGWWGAVPLLAAFVCIIRSLLRVSRELDGWGYAVTAAPVRMGPERWQGLFYGSLLFLLLAFSLSSNHNPPKAEPFEQMFDSRQTVFLREELAALGFPEEYAARLLPEDLETLAGAVRCDSDGVDGVPLGNDGNNVYQNQPFAFLFPDGSVRVVRFFVPGDSGGFWQCGITIRSNAGLSGAKCRLFYSNGKQPMTASVDFRETEHAAGIDFFGTSYEEYSASTQPFSFPVGAWRRSGYVLFEADQAANPMTMLSEMLYYSDPKYPQYPFGFEAPKPSWSAGGRYYYGDGSGLMYKADEAASRDS